MLEVVHKWRDLTWERQRAIGRCCRPYDWVADKHTTSKADRWKIAWSWYKFAMNVPKPSPAQSSGVPAWFASALMCIGLHEEGGNNSIAGYYGFVYPPGSYGPVDQSLVGTYGSSWLNWPRDAQNRVAYMLYGMYGWSPWTTAPGCGLA